MRLLALLLVAACASAPAPVLIDTSQGRLNVFADGSGPGVPIVFIHGNGANLTQWAGQLQHFAESRRVVAIDLRGMGNSDVPMDGVYTLEAMTDDIHSVMNTLNIDRFVIVGHSYGGSVASAYAAAHPERVAGVVYADAAGTVAATDEQWDGYLSALRMDKHKVIRTAFEPILKTAAPEIQAAVYSSVDRTSTEAFSEAMEDLRHFDVKRAIAAYEGPVLVIAAVDTPSSLHVQFPDLPMRRIDGVGHWLMMEKPAEFNLILEEFVRGLDAR